MRGYFDDDLLTVIDIYTQIVLNHFELVFSKFKWLYNLKFLEK